MSNTSLQTREIKFKLPDYNGIGIYSIICNETGERYIGSSIHIRNRLKSHEISFNSGKCNKKINKLIQSGCTFRIEIIEKIPDGINRFHLIEKEYDYINKFNCIEHGLNLSINCGETREATIRLLNAWKNDNYSTPARRKTVICDIEELIKNREAPIYSHWEENKNRNSPISQSKYNKKMYFASAKLNPDNAEDKALIDKIESLMKEKSLSRQAAIKELLRGSDDEKD